ncbi:hypothetical protein TL16_g04187 [Triparma laevis f. inornata]|uniref:30S ribosomal protein S9 n=2 Tax=Triparma laevis TaxID=1534972 RepID=A0A9W7F1H5_9STRA|nr:hypothetical protein TL16_g04187 [Triparma laevis f. inornata]GMI00190.1 hypothetical protein TrLO_g11711 [Triparma laevis f. longispina]
MSLLPLLRPSALPLTRSFSTSITAIGRRKTSQAKVTLTKLPEQEFWSEIRVNGKGMEDYFVRISDRDTLISPLLKSSTLGLYSITASTRGGGTTGQVGAIRLGIARCLEKEGYRGDLKGEGFLTRDGRRVERKKPGKPKARASKQWVKR